MIETNLNLIENINLINSRRNNIEDYVSEMNISNLLNNLSSLNVYNLCTLSPCGAGRTMLGFDIDGSFYSCDYFIGNSEFKIGNIYEVNDIKMSIYKSQSAQKLLKRDIDSIKECKVCTWKMYVHLIALQILILIMIHYINHIACANTQKNYSSNNRLII